MEIEGDWHRDGAVCVRGLFGPAEVALATEAIDALLADPSPLAITASRPGDGRFVEDFCNWQRVPALNRFVTSHCVRAAALVARLTGASAIRLFHDHMLTKEAGTSQHTPWHQDQPYYNVDGRQNASMWMPVDPVDAATSLQLIAGSHRGPWYLPRTFLDEQARWFPEGSLRELPDYDAEPGQHRVLSWALEPGDAVFFHFLTVHGAPGVASTAPRRRVLSVRFVGDDMVHAPRRWRTSPPFEGLADELPEGAPLDHPLFPVLWSR